MIKTYIKMIVTPEESKQVQEICFANGIGWNGGTNRVQLIGEKYLFIDEYLTYTKEMDFIECTLEEVDASLFIRTQGTCVEDLLSESYADNLEYLSDFWNKEETMEKNEVENYADVKEYLIAKGLYERVLEIDWDYADEGVFSGVFAWDKTEEGHNFWNKLNDKLRRLEIHNKIDSLVQDYKAKQGKEFIEHLEAQPEEVVETKPIQKPKQYLCYVQGKALPKHIHKTLEQAKQEAQRLCRKELARVSVLEVVAEYEAEVLVKEVL